MGFMFFDLHVSLNNPSSGDINSSNLPCYLLKGTMNSSLTLCIEKCRVDKILVTMI